ncbi:hypothetical protein H6G89_04905 [Oscillatoria sp. FACHB-1407]|uniref:hypothetical protein n=1 Tax=Oscillatoria sp. FACHB-1407 TaxID=2692847 RepID=UPI001689A70E|nr:hypothetical protein [Oscillatoria sp. FACHB-1407]MBD2460377.1 hypothetical protein [Oscillatoria sp. FACHB-1407]
MKRIPWLSLSLLLIAYSSFSWFLYQSTATWIVWLIALSFALTQALLLTAFLQGFRFFVKGWLKSDIGYFSVISIGAFSIAAILVWIHVFEYVLLLIAAEVLARMDLQNAGFNQWQALGVLTLVSISGLSVGYTAQELTFNL